MYTTYLIDLLGWIGPWDYLYRYALYHDLDELITGDIVAPVKHNIVDRPAAMEYVRSKMLDTMPDVQGWLDQFDRGELCSVDDAIGIKLIVKAADQLDALLFLVTEQALGNKVAGSRIDSAKDRAVEAFDKLEKINARGSDLISWLDDVVRHHCLVNMYDIDARSCHGG